MNSVLDRVVPYSVADLGYDSGKVYAAGREGGDCPPFDAFLTFYKGVVGGALMGVGAEEVMYLHSDDHPFLYEGGDGSRVQDDIVEFLDIQGPDRVRKIELRQPSGPPEPEGQYVLCTDVRLDYFERVHKDDSGKIYGMIKVQIEAEGGPPFDLFLFEARE